MKARTALRAKLNTSLKNRRKFRAPTGQRVAPSLPWRPIFSKAEHEPRAERWLASGVTTMPSNARIFFAGIGTTFVILALGFGGGLMLASSTLPDPAGRSPSASERLSPVRVVLPTSAEPARPPQPTLPSPAVPESEPKAQQAKEAPAPVERQVEATITRKDEAGKREHRSRSAERRIKKLAAARARQQLFEQQRRAREPGIMAFGGDEQPRISGFFGN
jgi:hypothetical protein